MNPEQAANKLNWIELTIFTYFLEIAGFRAL
jgi:hypothetical protein